MNETGGHRIQQASPTDKRGRIHTSTITVAVLDEQKETKIEIRHEDLEWKFCRSGGKGGQNVNKRSSVAILTHKPTGIVIRCEEERSQGQNREKALKLLKEKLYSSQINSSASQEAALRKEQVGCGARGDKRRTIQEQNGIVIDHVLNKTWNIKDYYKGNFDHE